MNLQRPLAQVVGLPGAIVLGLGSILGTGVFVTLSIATNIAGEGVLVALLLAAALAIFNGLSSAELAAAYPISGGTYEYGNRTLGPAFGFAAGWLFLCAKTASCATAALGAAGYLLRLGSDLTALPLMDFSSGLKPTAIAMVLIVTALACMGLKRTNSVNATIVGATLICLGALVAAGFAAGLQRTSFFDYDTKLKILQLGSEARQHSWPSILEATALLFVAYTGYGRIATMGEEVKSPAHTIPRAIVVTLGIALLTYTLVASASIAAVGVTGFGEASTQSVVALAGVADKIGLPRLSFSLSTVSVVAMLGVQLNLILGLSRVALAMGRRGEAPARLAKLSGAQGVPIAAILTIGGFIVLIIAASDFKASWSFSAFTVLVYYALTHLAALRLPKSAKARHPSIAYAGLAACLFLAFWLERNIVLSGSVLLGIGFLFRYLIKWTHTRHWRKPSNPL